MRRMRSTARLDEMESSRSLLPLPACHQGVYARLRRAMERVGVRGRIPKLRLAKRAAAIAAATLIGALLTAIPRSALAQGADERPVRREVWDIKLGAKVADLPDDYVDYACGTNGGPPSTPLTGWKDYRRCRPETNGLREVYFRYDDELEYWAKANNLAAQMEQYVGTKTYGFPIIVSVLAGDEGTVRGIRIVSDPRDPTGDRDEAYLLRNFLNARFGREG